MLKQLLVLGTTLSKDPRFGLCAPSQSGTSASMHENNSWQTSFAPMTANFDQVSILDSPRCDETSRVRWRVFELPLAFKLELILPIRVQLGTAERVLAFLQEP